MANAPGITSLRITQLGANFVHLQWDSVGSNFFYVVEYALVSQAQSSENEGLNWLSLGVTQDPEWFDSALLAESEYKYRIAVSFPGLDQSEWEYTEIFETFTINAYTVSSLSQTLPNQHFITEKLENNDVSYVDFNNDAIYATLMDEDFTYDSGIANISNVSNFILEDSEHHEVQGSISRVCSDVDRTSLGYNNGVIYVFETYQNQVKVSNDGGQNWWYYNALIGGRVGDPLTPCVLYQNNNTSFVLGYDQVYYGRSADIVRFGSTLTRWSNDEFTFTKPEVEGEIPFPTLGFTAYSNYPDNIKRKVEAQAGSDDWIYAVAEDNFRRIVTRNSRTGDDGEGGTVRLWDAETYNITNNPLTVVKKLDILNGVCYALVTGEVEDMTKDRRDIDNILPSEHAGVYRFDEYYVPDDFTFGDFTYVDFDDGVDFVDGIDINRRIAVFVPDGSHVGLVRANWAGREFVGRTNGTVMTVTNAEDVYSDGFEFSADIYEQDGITLDPVKVALFNEDFAFPATFDIVTDNPELKPASGDWVRVYGVDELERSFISPRYSNMSTDGSSVFVSCMTYKKSFTVDDPDLPESDEWGMDVNEAVRYNSEYGYNSDKKIHFHLIKTFDGITFNRAPQRYYAEAEFNYMHAYGERIWKNHENKAVVVNPSKQFTYRVDEERLVNKETFDKGKVTFTLDNIEFRQFSKYSNGIMIHKSLGNTSGGEIVAYYEFPYRVRDNVSVIWRPEYELLQANLQQQTREVEFEPEIPTGLVDPDLSPLIRKMGPETYFGDGELFTKFGEYYLQFISQGTNSHYNKLLNLIRNKYPREENSFEWLWSEVRRRNIYLNAEKRDEVVRFFEANAANFYSSKGTEASYKFLFKLLYNADVEVETESSVGLDYDIVVSSTNIDKDLVGRIVYTKTGRASVTYIERVYEDGLLRWKITIHNLTGAFTEGQELLSETSAFTGEILRGIRGKELAYSDLDYINRDRSYYVMRIKSELNTATWRNDVIRFVHPVGFGFIGVTLLTVFINGGISMVHNQTIVDLMKTHRWDAGLPTTWSETTNTPDPDSPNPLDPEPLFDDFGEVVEIDRVVGGVGGSEFDVAEWEDAIDTDTGLVFEARDYDNDEDLYDVGLGPQLPSERRLKGSPLFSAFSTRFTDFKSITEERLKDDGLLPRDFANQTSHHPNFGADVPQIKIGK